MSAHGQSESFNNTSEGPAGQRGAIHIILVACDDKLMPLDLMRPLTFAEQIDLLFLLPDGVAAPKTESEISDWVRRGHVVQGLKFTPSLSGKTFSQSANGDAKPSETPLRRFNVETDGDNVVDMTGAPCQDWANEGSGLRIQGARMKDHLSWATKLWVEKPPRGYEPSKSHDSPNVSPWGLMYSAPMGPLDPHVLGPRGRSQARVGPALLGFPGSSWARPQSPPCAVMGWSFMCRPEPGPHGPPWILVGRALVGTLGLSWGQPCRASPGLHGPGPCGCSWAVMGWTLMGIPGFSGAWPSRTPLGSYRLGPRGPPWALMCPALLGLPGPSWAGPSWAPMGIVGLVYKFEPICLFRK